MRQIEMTEDAQRQVHELNQALARGRGLIQGLFHDFLKASEVEADLERIAREEGTRPANDPAALEHMARADKFAAALSNLRIFQTMLAEEMSTAIRMIFGDREALTAILAQVGAGREERVSLHVEKPSFAMPAPPDGEPA